MDLGQSNFEGVTLDAGTWNWKFLGINKWLTCQFNF